MPEASTVIDCAKLSFCKLGLVDMSKNKIKHAKTFAELQMPRHTAVMNEIENERQTDRGVAIVGAAYVDLVLRQNITEKFVVQDEGLMNLLFENRGPLQDFGSRIEVAYALGVCGRAAYEDLKRIKNIRNAFAHSAEALDFLHPDIERLCSQLWYPKRISVTNRPNPEKPREQYVRAISLLTDLLHSDSLRRQRGMRGESLIMASGLSSLLSDTVPKPRHKNRPS